MMNKIQIMENVIGKYKNSIERLKPSLESINAGKRARARDAIDYARKQIAEGEKIIQKEKDCMSCSVNCDKCENVPNMLKEQIQ